MRGCLAVGVAALLALAPRHANAQAGAIAHPSVSLEVDPCVQADVAEVRRIVGIELGALLEDREPAGGAATTKGASDTTRVTVACAGPLVELRVDDPLTGKGLTRPIDLSTSSATARSRLLAIAIAELVAASWTELESNPHPRVVPAGPPASTAAREAATSSPPCL